MGPIAIDRTPVRDRNFDGELGVQVGQFEHLGHVGRLRLFFADGRLYRAVFTPSSPEDYFARVEGLAGALRPAPGEVWFDPSTRVHLLKGGRPGDEGVAWEDECIGEELANRFDRATALRGDFAAIADNFDVTRPPVVKDRAVLEPTRLVTARPRGRRGSTG